MRVALAGFGGVGRALAALAFSREEQSVTDFGLRIRICAAGTRSTTLWGDLDPGTLAFVASRALPLTAYRGGHRETSLVKAALLARAHVLVDATSSDIWTGQPGLDLLRAAMNQGLHAVVLSKGPLLTAYKELQGLSQSARVHLKASGATAAALPCLDVAEVSLAGTTLLSINGILNGTTNYLLGRMEEGIPLALALQETVHRGIAEPDPRWDLEGWDTAAKTVLLANIAMGAGIGLSAAAVEGIGGLDAAFVQDALAQGKRVKLVGSAVRGVGGIKVQVGPQVLPCDHFLASVNGADKAVSLETDTMGTLSLVGGRSDPRGAAAAAYKDIINIFRPRP
ncbi:MAG: homoserine dehydrogenase [Bacillota bacterium]